jgi:hypothetical protein
MSTDRIAAETDMSVPFVTKFATSHQLHHYKRYVIGHDPGPFPSPISHPSSSDTTQRYSPPSTIFQYVYLQCVFPSYCSLYPGLAKWPLYCSLLDCAQVIRIYNLICNAFAFCFLFNWEQNIIMHSHMHNNIQHGGSVLSGKTPNKNLRALWEPT